MGGVLFVSQLPLGRCENLTAVWDAYDGQKEFRLGADSMRSAEKDGFGVVVCDCLPKPIEGKEHVKSVNIGHGITGDKLYAADEGDKPWYDQVAADQIDYAVVASRAGAATVARQFRIPEDRVVALGMPRTDAYFRDGFEFTHVFGEPVRRVYLYAPTFRLDDGWLPRIDWARIDSLLGEGEVMVVKRHYFTDTELTRGYDTRDRRVIEVSPNDPSAPYLRSCSALLTDYSSIMFDAYLLGKPVVLAVDDMGEYLAKRGMYYEYPAFYSSRWLSVEGCEEMLVEELRYAADAGMRDVERRCVETVADSCDGHSAERVCELVRSLL